MSYDLYFEAGPGKTLDKKSFGAWFRARPHYQVGKGQALYQNEDTGVYFIFDEPGKDGIVAMNLNLFRPHTFGLEAAREIEAFAGAFDAIVADPQQETDADDDEDDPGGKPFARDAFLRSYNQSNEFAYRAMIEEQDPQPHTWPSRRIRDVWKWNYTRPTDEDQEKLGFFVPCIFAAEVDVNLWSVAIWPPQCGIILPEVDGVLVPLAQSGKAAEATALVPWSELMPIVKKYQDKSDGMPRYRLDNEPAFPAEIAAFLNVKRKAVGTMTGVALDEILDRELADAATRKA